MFFDPRDDPIARLRTEHPDLYARMEAGRLRPTTALRKARLFDTRLAARSILEHFEDEQLAELIRILTERTT